MPMTYGEKLAYHRGVNRARASARERVRRVLEIAKGYRQRSSMGAHPERQCASCSRWERGGEKCIWGRCRADFEFGTEPRMWAESFGGERRSGLVITTEDFACVNWLPKSLLDHPELDQQPDEQE
jgi:hypothetical protein